MDHFYDPIHLIWITIVTGSVRLILFGSVKGSEISVQAFCAK